MRFTLSTKDSKVADDSSVVVEQAEIVPSKRGGTSRKWVIGAVVVITVVCLILAAILIGVYVFIDGEKKLLQEMIQLADNSQVNRKVNLQEKIVEYHIKNSAIDQWTVDDLNKQLEVARLITSDGDNCFVYPINATSRTDLDNLNQPMNANRTRLQEMKFQVFDTPILDTSFLSETARNLCEGKPMYWIRQACPDSPQLRVKRKWWWWIGITFTFWF